MQRLIGSELTSLGRRVLAEMNIDTLSPEIRAALHRLNDAEAAARVRSSPNALRVNGYL
jgi:hypothetical protein